MNADNNFTFTGKLTHVIRKATKRDKPFTELVVLQRDGDFDSLCVCTFWHRLPDGAGEGAVVRVVGRLDGREWNGKHYAGLTAETVEVQAARAPECTEERPDSAPAGAADNLPF